MPLPFRQRIFVILVALTAVPTALAVVGWALAVRTVAPSAGARVALEEMTASARLMVDRMDTTHLSVRRSEERRVGEECRVGWWRVHRRTKDEDARADE